MEAVKWKGQERGKEGREVKRGHQFRGERLRACLNFLYMATIRSCAFTALGLMNPTVPFTLRNRVASAVFLLYWTWHVQFPLSLWDTLGIRMGLLFVQGEVDCHL